MGHWEHPRWRIFNAQQHPYKHNLDEFIYTNPLLPGITTPEEAFNYIISVLYPKYIGTFANVAALPGTATANDYAIVSDDGSGFAAGYVWMVIDNAGSWNKRYDMQWSMDSVLAETVNRTQYMYVQKYGMTDRDASGNALTGANAGQHIYGGDTANQNLTLHATSGDTLGTRTGWVQFDDACRPTVTDTLDFGSASERWNTGYFKDLEVATITTTGNVGIGGNLVVTGNASAANLSGTNTGNITLAAVGAVPNGNAASLSGQQLTLQPADGTNPGVLTAGAQTIGGAKTFTGALLAQSTLDVSGNATVGGTLVVTGTITGSNLSGTNTGDITLAAVGSSPNGNAASLSGQQLTLQPADGTNPGLLTALAQTIGGAKTLTGATVLSSAGTALSVTNNVTIGNDLTLSGNLKNGANTFLTTELMALRNVQWRDTGRTSAAQTGDALFYDAVSGTWLANKPDTEIDHTTISGLLGGAAGDGGHSQFVMLTGRSGGQVVQGGTSASENLALESTANATKGSIFCKDVLSPFTNASYAAGWSGTDVGDATHYWRDVYTKGQHFGLRLENVGSLGANSAQNTGRLVYLTDVISVDNGTNWISAVMTTQAQTIAGSKTFTSNGFFQSKLGVGNSITSANVELDVNGAWATRRTDVASAATIASLSSATSFVKITGVLATVVQGVGSGQDGKRVMIHNSSSGALTVSHQNASASAADRIISPSGADIIITQNKSIELIYDTNQSRWVVSGGGVGGGNVQGIAVQTIGGAGSITVSLAYGMQFLRVQGSGGPTSASLTPFGTGGGWQDGTLVILVGQDDTNTLTITNSDGAKGAIINGNCTLGANQILALMYDATADRWVQVFRGSDV